MTLLYRKRLVIKIKKRRDVEGVADYINHSLKKKGEREIYIFFLGQHFFIGSIPNLESNR